MVFQCRFDCTFTPSSTDISNKDMGTVKITFCIKSRLKAHSIVHIKNRTQEVKGQIEKHCTIRPLFKDLPTGHKKVKLNPQTNLQNWLFILTVQVTVARNMWSFMVMVSHDMFYTTLNETAYQVLRVWLKKSNF